MVENKKVNHSSVCLVFKTNPHHEILCSFLFRLLITTSGCLSKVHEASAIHSRSISKMDGGSLNGRWVLKAITYVCMNCAGQIIVSLFQEREDLSWYFLCCSRHKWIVIFVTWAANISLTLRLALFAGLHPPVCCLQYG